MELIFDMDELNASRQKHLDDKNAAREAESLEIMKNLETVIIDALPDAFTKFKEYYIANGEFPDCVCQKCDMFVTDTKMIDKHYNELKSKYPGIVFDYNSHGRLHSHYSFIIKSSQFTVKE